MRQEAATLVIPAANLTRGPAVRIGDLTAAAVYVHQAGTMNVSLKVQAKVGDGHDDWADLATVTNANTLVPIPAGYTHVAIYRTSVTSAGVAAVVSGKNARSE